MNKRAVYPDVRVVRTRAQLKEALLTLLKEKAFHSIKIKEIAEKATINRVTFYDHYSTKEELLSELIEDKLSEYADIIHNIPLTPLHHASSSHILEPIRLSVEHIRKNAAFYQIMLLTNGVPEFSARFHERLTQSLSETLLEVQPHNKKMDSQLFIQWSVGGAISVFTYWLKSDMRLPAEDIVTQIHMITLALNKMLND